MSSSSASSVGSGSGLRRRINRREVNLYESAPPIPGIRTRSCGGPMWTRALKSTLLPPAVSPLRAILRPGSTNAQNFRRLGIGRPLLLLNRMGLRARFCSSRSIHRRVQSRSLRGKHNPESIYGSPRRSGAPSSRLSAHSETGRADAKRPARPRMQSQGSTLGRLVLLNASAEAGSGSPLVTAEWRKQAGLDRLRRAERS
jgi:hypothetical protein